MRCNQPPPLESKYIVQKIFTNLSFLETVKLSITSKSWNLFLNEMKFHPHPPSIGEQYGDWMLSFTEKKIATNDIPGNRRESVLSCIKRIDLDESAYYWLECHKMFPFVLPKINYVHISDYFYYSDELMNALKSKIDFNQVRRLNLYEVDSDTELFVNNFPNIRELFVVTDYPMDFSKMIVKDIHLILDVFGEPMKSDFHNKVKCLDIEPLGFDEAPYEDLGVIDYYDAENIKGVEKLILRINHKGNEKINQENCHEIYEKVFCSLPKSLKFIEILVGNWDNVSYLPAEFPEYFCLNKLSCWKYQSNKSGELFIQRIEK